MALPEYAKPRDVQAFAEGLTTTALECRTYGHGMRPYAVDSVKVEGHRGRFYEVTLRCRCRVKKRLVMNQVTGDVIRSNYDYSEAPGYLTQGIGRVVGEGRSVLRRESITRILERPQPKGR